MSKRLDKKKGIIQPASENQNKREKLFNAIAHAYKHGADYVALQNQYNDKVLNIALARFAHEAPNVLESLLGKPPTQKSILIDESTPLSVLPYVLQNIGYADTIQHSLGKGIKDGELYYLASLKFDILLTSDARSEGPKDISNIARESYERNDDHQMGVIVVPVEAELALASLSEAREEILEYVRIGRFDHVLDLTR